jgi:cytochrome P450
MFDSEQKLRVPAPEPYPVLGWRGNVLAITSDPFTYISDLKQRFGKVAGLVRGGNPAILFPQPECPGTVFVFGVENNRAVMSQPNIFQSGPIIGPAYGNWTESEDQAVLRRVGTGLFSLNGEIHQKHRRLLLPAFHRRQIDIYASVIVSLTERLLDSWHIGELHDIQREMFHHTLTVAGQTLFGQDFAEQAADIGATIQEWLQLIPIVSIDPHDTEQLPYQRFLAICKRLDEQIRTIIDAKRHAPDGSEDALSALISARDEDGSALSEDDLVGHINILLTAGHETTANAISWTLMLLSQHPQIAAELYEEIHGAFQGSPPSPEKLKALPLLDRVVKESMRLFPPVTMGSRLVSENTELGGYALPAGTEIAFSHFHTHHDPEIYGDAARFIPGRWENITPDPYEYFPFSTGVKMCLGAPFALMEIKIVLAMFLQRFRAEFTPVSPINRHVWVPFRPNCMPLTLREPGSGYHHGVGLLRGNVREIVDLPS